MPGRLRIPLSFRRHNQNLPQEAGSAPIRFFVNILAMQSRISEFAARIARPSLFALTARLMPFLLPLVAWIGGLVGARAAVVATPRVTLVVFADKHLPDDEWMAVAAALQKSFENVALESRSQIGGFDVVRGETLSPGAVFDTVVPVYLHGDCRLVGQPAHSDVRGPLGWVLRDHGQIEPFIHVDCRRLSEVLGRSALWMNHGTRNAAMAEAIAHVVLHEWIHIATQNAGHTREGVSKESFAVDDLVPGYARILPHAGGK